MDQIENKYVRIGVGLLGVLFFLGVWLKPRPVSIMASPEAKQTAVEKAAKKPIEVIITVRKGFSLSEISQDLNLDWRKVAKANGLKNPDKIFIGQKLRVTPYGENNIAVASFYGEAFHGKKMSNGKTFDMNNPTTAAHKWLPLGTMVRLTSLDTKKSLIVTIRDRGPYIKGRSFDLSKGAAEEMGILKLGITKCQVEIIIPEKELK